MMVCECSGCVWSCARTVTDVTNADCIACRVVDCGCGGHEEMMTGCCLGASGRSPGGD
jgi:hypothetical protein